MKDGVSVVVKDGLFAVVKDGVSVVVKIGEVSLQIKTGFRDIYASEKTNELDNSTNV